MQNTKKLIIEAIGERASRQTGRLASELIEARPEEKEELLAEMQFHQWLAESCFDCL